ncbi:hypothetical protein [uncultured Kordia sp.]|uniref:hypothetical protein n=1 Tax=uncultured Kordia sp. TaxID=507699 RepID=UPI00262E518F|nr:hypothetical protein [uncultured Kordia sp.]
MKYFFTIVFFTLSLTLVGQENNPDFKNLVQLGEIYSNNVNATGEDFKKSVEALRTPGLNHIIDALIAVGAADEKLLTKEFLSKPSAQELKYWYVIREIHYNNQPETTEVKSSEQVAKETLAKEIDSRALVDNYYYRIQSGIAKIFNEKDLSTYNFNLDEYGLENDTEKAMLYFSISNALTQRFRVLNMVENYDKLLEFASKLPTFNEKPYYEYTAFDFEDFEWTGYDKKESYKKAHLKELYGALYGHFVAFAKKEKGEELRNLYFNSIFSTPDYFKYAAELEESLQQLYSQSKK